MSAHNKVVWSEGLFLQPQHFQQQDRYLERVIEARCQPLIPHSWGLTEFELERDLLSIGKFALRRGAGVFPDGTPFRMPEDDPLPAPMAVGPPVRDRLCIWPFPYDEPMHLMSTRPPARMIWSGTTCASGRRVTRPRRPGTRRFSKSAPCGRGFCSRAT